MLFEHAKSHAFYQTQRARRVRSPWVPMKIMALALAGLAVLAAVFLFGINHIVDLSNPPLAIVGTTGSVVADPDDLKVIIPDGTEMSFDEFKQKAPDVAKLLTPLNPSKIRRDGDLFTLTGTPTTIAKQGVTVYIAGKISSEVTKSGNVITLKKIDGIDVDTGIGRAKLREATITPGPNNTATIDGKLELSRWLPWISFSVTVDTTQTP